MARGRGRRPVERGARNGGGRNSPPRSPPRYRDDNAYDRNRQPASDSWRPGDNYSREPPRSYRDDHRNDHRNGDSYRPNPPQGDFTFRFDKPAGISDQPPRMSFPPQRNHRGNDRNGRGGFSSRGRRGAGRGRWQPPPHPSERALLTGTTAGIGETRLGDDGTAKFHNLDDMSDDDELEMSMSSDEEPENPDEPSRKRARVDTSTEDAAAAPKWSNPDPYTALPPPDETTKKKRDFVSLIRKARVEEDAVKPAATAEPEQFLSFDLTEDEDDQEEDKSQSVSVNGSRRPSPPRDAPPPLPPGPPPSSLPPRPPTGPRADLPPASASLSDRKDTLGSRKRTADDEIKPPNYQLNKKPGMKASKGHISAQWLAKGNEEACPWQTVNHSATRDMAFRLHKEVVDFYEYVRPRRFEQRIRDELVENLRRAMKRDARNWMHATVHPFGSFMSGLYLPTADMDLVVCSPSFMKGGPPTFLSARNWLYKFKRFLEMQRIADGDSIEVIAHARVPLVKYVDKQTGLRVDVSFESMGGVNAVDTFLEWKRRYPSMPILVTLVKHFLLMRGLNEPVNGGIGGFTVICLVVSMLQLMPQVQSRSLIPEHHLGEMLLEFFELYGRRFDYQTVAIQLTSPPMHINKDHVTTIAYRNTDRLSIIDPNNSSNDISGGSANISIIQDKFRSAYQDIRGRMVELARTPQKGSILEIIMKGDYSSFRKQRDYLQHVHEKTLGPCTD